MCCDVYARRNGWLVALSVLLEERENGNSFNDKKNISPSFGGQRSDASIVSLDVLFPVLRCVILLCLDAERHM